MLNNLKQNIKCNRYNIINGNTYFLLETSTYVLLVFHLFRFSVQYQPNKKYCGLLKTQRLLSYKLIIQQVTCTVHGQAKSTYSWFSEFSVTLEIPELSYNSL